MKMNRDKIGTQTCYIHQCTKRYVDVIIILYLLVSCHFFTIVSNNSPYHVLSISINI